MSEEVSPNQPAGFGLRLVRMLVKRIGGKMKIEQDHGTRFTIEFIVK